MEHSNEHDIGPLALAVDTSGRHGSVAIGRADRVLHERPFSAAMRHGAELLPSIQDLMGSLNARPASIRHVYITVGPGSFTGLRIGLSLAKMLALTQDVRVVALNTLDVLAENAADLRREGHAVPDRLACILDAKRGEFFVAVYRWTGKEWGRDSEDRLLPAEQFLQEYTRRDDPIALLGEGLVYYEKKFKDPSVRILPDSAWYPRARHVYALGRRKAALEDFADPVKIVPLYLRGPDALEKWQRKVR